MSLIEIENGTRGYTFRNVEEAIKAANAARMTPVIDLVSAPQTPTMSASSPLNEMTPTEATSSPMSSETAAPGPRAKRQVYFMYSYYDPHEFASLFSGTRLLCVGLLRGWTFHVNERNVPNIRLYFDDSTYVISMLPANLKKVGSSQPSSKPWAETWGYIYDVTPEAQQQIDDSIGDLYFKFVGTVTAMTPKLGPVNASITFHADPRHTTDMEGSQLDPDELQKWYKAMDMMKTAGFPKEYREYVTSQLHGEAPNREGVIRIKRGTTQALDMELPGFFSSPTNSPASEKEVAERRARRRASAAGTGSGSSRPSRESSRLSNGTIQKHSARPRVGESIARSRPIQADAGTIRQVNIPQMRNRASHVNETVPVSRATLAQGLVQKSEQDDAQNVPPVLSSSFTALSDIDLSAPYDESKFDIASSPPAF
ncbi:hypothetical protein F5884DRAFT_850130 [Xylogone sp. PMI_703]|nr:hypothetical protein F5884DRAFT_850130 [Xylogone sp. PMI_703]